MSAQRFDNQFNRADINHDGTIDQSEFRNFLGPIQNERRLSGNISAEDVKNFVRKS
jgi:Ca2+-binding EF-hand superfamily protein